jgi:alanine racemase
MNVGDHPAWIEIDLKQFRRNLQSVWAAKNARTGVALVLKDDAYGHGAPELARVAEELEPSFLAVATVAEGIALRKAGIFRPILLLGERIPHEFACCIQHQLTPCVGTLENLAIIRDAAASQSIGFGVHLKIDTGMSRYGLRAEQLESAFALIKDSRITVEGMLSHFAMSDETDKSFARRQLRNFEGAVKCAAARGIKPKYLHLSNSGGFLDLEEAHYDLVRVGIIAAGIYPSTTCRRIPEIAPVMSVRARVVTIKEISAGDHVGYGMRFTALRPTRLAVLPIGYGSGFPRVRNEGSVLLHGQRAPIVGGVSMDALTVDVTGIPETRIWDTATILGSDGPNEIDAHELAALKRSVSYDVVVSWQRLPRIYLG